MFKLLLASIAVYVAWSTALFFYFLGPWGRSGLDLYICWPTFTIPIIVFYFLVELIALKACRYYQQKCSRVFHLIWLTHDIAALVTSMMSTFGIVEPYSKDPGGLLYIFITCNVIALLHGCRIVWALYYMGLSMSTGDELAEAEETLVALANLK